MINRTFFPNAHAKEVTTQKQKHTHTMVLTISYSTVSQVFESWDTIRHVKNYHEVVGVHLFRKCVLLLNVFVYDCDISQLFSIV